MKITSIIAAAACAVVALAGPDPLQECAALADNQNLCQDSPAFINCILKNTPANLVTAVLDCDMAVDLKLCETDPEVWQGCGRSCARRFPHVRLPPHITPSQSRRDLAQWVYSREHDCERVLGAFGCSGIWTVNRDAVTAVSIGCRKTFAENCSSRIRSNDKATLYRSCFSGPRV